MENELKKEVDLVLYENQNIVVGNKEDYSKAGDVLKLVKNKIKFLEDKRKEYTSGLVAQKKAIDDDFKKMQEPLKELLKGIDVVMVAWNIAEQKRLDEEQRKIEAEALEKLKKVMDIYINEMNMPLIIFSSIPGGAFEKETTTMDESAGGPLVEKSYNRLGQDEFWKRTERFYQGDYSAFSSPDMIVRGTVSSGKIFQ